MSDQYVKPYVESSVFIAWVRGENGVVIRGEVFDCAVISETVLNDAQNGDYQIVTSHLTIAEVHKKRGFPKLNENENGHLLRYFENPFFAFVEVDRAIAEEANRLCRRYSDLKLLPNDAIHLASAVRAGCDVLLTWDKVLKDIDHPQIKTEWPRITKQGPLFSNTE